MVGVKSSSSAWLLLAAVALLVASASAQCENNCSAHGECTANGCFCEQGWSGSDCSQYVCGAHTDGCSGHGQCSSTGCVCHSGYGGYNCASITTNCPNNCLGHGMCLDGACSCDQGYVGLDCGQVDQAYACPANCSGHGFCDTSGSVPQCECMPSFWSTPSCSTELSLCPEALSNCTGHGICGPANTHDPLSPWVCACELGYCGDACNIACPGCPNNCTGHGVCLGTVCQCDPGFAGADCTTVVSVAECAFNCSGHGRCRLTASGYRCVCDLGYYGTGCKMVEGVCPFNCSGKGECLPDGSCACMPGFTGDGCQQALGSCAASNNCSGNGLCVNGVCSCYQGFRGYDCTTACHVGGIGDIGCHADQGHGVCVNGTCICKDGEWEGEGCEIRSHDTTMGSLTSRNNPIGVIVSSILGAAVVVALIGGFLKYRSGKKGLNAMPGVEGLRMALKGEDYEASPDNRYASNF